MHVLLSIPTRVSHVIMEKSTEAQDLETFYWNNRSLVRKKVKWAEVERNREDVENKNICHLRSLLSELSVETGECDVCGLVRKKESYEKVLCIECEEEREICLEKCKENFFLHPAKNYYYYCLKCLSKESRKRKSDLLEAELYDLKVKKVKSELGEENVVIFPFNCVEEIACSELVGVSYSLREEDYTDNEYFVCDICHLTAKIGCLVGKCMECEKSLGSCCYYENQWSDRIGENFDFPESARFLCPLCVEEKSLSISSSLSDSDEY